MLAQNLNIEDLIQPINADIETGTNPRDDVSPTSIYYLLKDIRNTSRAKERKALVNDENLLSIATDWRPILEQVPEILKNQCKDLEFVAWLVEALCRIHGFKGLTLGFTLAAELIERYWDNLYPTPDLDDLSERLAPLIGLNGIESEGSLIQPIKAILITEGQSEGPFSTWQYEQALDVDRLDNDKQIKKFESGAVSLEEVEIAIKETPDSFFIQLNKDIDDSILAFNRLSEVMDVAMGGDPQPTSYISAAIQACSICVKQLAENVLKKSAEEEYVEEAEDTDNEMEKSESNLGINQQINSREKAIQNLDVIAAYFRKTEPHSPMSYAIEQVIRWSELSLPELLQELIQDGDARNGFFKLSGIRTENET
ncbi:type VI secretion system protein TssA [Colwellia sp. E2M01]|uniref:type VI secretion system protein TssA n=1 Tax=Colwellia sp. E2M01 TaxID=2841561 RepID=UPI001C08B0BB|nr:type VI secretion system protein TssA [Colwellia sp. E2M01]MBU2870483.1 type VI secretion system protein TssA [Colwellia sp. E2M01]